MESEELRYLHCLGPAWAPELDELVDSDHLEDPEDADKSKAPAEPESPPGEKLMEALAEGLRGLQWNCDYTWATYRGHAFDARRVKRRYDVELWLVDAEDGRWEIVAEPRRGLFHKIFPQKRDLAEEALLRLQIEEVLGKTRDISDVSPWRDVPYEH